MNIVPIGQWIYYSDNNDHLETNKVGKWMNFFNDMSYIAEICEKAVANGIVGTAKHTNDDTGVACFYLNIDDIEAHKKILTFFMENDLIRKTKKGRYFNISFKLDNQTRAGDYGDDFVGKVTLDQFIDLDTGEWIAD